MVTVSGNSILDGFTYGVPLKQIYTHGKLVWDRYSEYYISWTPVNLNQSFSINGITYQMSQFSGYFTGFNGIITRAAFYQTDVSTIETNAIGIDVNAFYSCSLLTSIDLPECTYIYGGFTRCKNLIEVSAPKLIQLGNMDPYLSVNNGGFDLCSKLSSIYLPECLSVRKGFTGCSRLTDVSLPKCVYIEDAFEHCSSLVSIELPECTYCGYDTFRECYSLRDVSLPKCSFIYYDAFAYCSSLSEISLPVCGCMAEGAFMDCINLNNIYLEYSSVCLISSDTFQGTPIDSGTGSIFVPQSLVEDYKSDSMWSKYASQIFPIPE